MQRASQSSSFFILHVQQLRRQFLQFQGSQLDLALRVQQFCHTASEFFVELSRTLFQCTPFGQVASYLGEATQFPLLVAERRDHYIRPKSRSILPDAQSLVGEPSFLSSHLQFPVRPPALARFGGIKHGKMLADDLVSLVALDPLRSLVPGRDPAILVQQEDGIISYATHQQTEDFVALSQTGFGMLPSRRLVNQCECALLHLRYSNRAVIALSAVRQNRYKIMESSPSIIESSPSHLVYSFPPRF